MVKMNKDDEEQSRKNDIFNNSRKEMYRKKILCAIQHHLKKTYHDIISRKIEPCKNYVYGIAIHVNKYGIPSVNEFGDYQEKKIVTTENFTNYDDQNALFDIVEYTNSIAITTEIFGIEKKDVNLFVNGQKLFIEIDEKKFYLHQTIVLPCRVIPNSISCTYINGVFDIILKKDRVKN